MIAQTQVQLLCINLTNNSTKHIYKHMFTIQTDISEQVSLIKLQATVYIFKKRTKITT